MYYKLLTGMICVGRDVLGAPGRRALRTAEIYDHFKYNTQHDKIPAPGINFMPDAG